MSIAEGQRRAVRSKVQRQHLARKERNIFTILNNSNVQIIINSVLDRHNIHNYFDLVDYFCMNFSDYIHGNNPRIIFNVGEECHPYNKSEYTKDNILASREYADQIYDAINYLIDKDCEVLQIAPSPICIRLKENDVIIGPEGDLYKCISGLGLSEFRMMTKEQFLNDPYQYFVYQANWIEDSRNECRNCDYKSLCNGGCKYNVFINNTSIQCDKEALSHSLEKSVLVMKKYAEKKGELITYGNN